MKLDEQIDGELNGKAANMKCFMFTKRWRQDSVTKYIKRKSIFFLFAFLQIIIFMIIYVRLFRHIRNAQPLDAGAFAMQNEKHDKPLTD